VVVRVTVDETIRMRELKREMGSPCPLNLGRGENYERKGLNCHILPQLS